LKLISRKSEILPSPSSFPTLPSPHLSLAVEDEVETEVFEVLGVVVEGDWTVDLTDPIQLVVTRLLLERKRLRLLRLLPQPQPPLQPPRRIRSQVSFRAGHGMKSEWRVRIVYIT
jgi:hypothetical protein